MGGTEEGDKAMNKMIIFYILSSYHISLQPKDEGTLSAVSICGTCLLFV